jgi:hypothetical protein
MPRRPPRQIGFSRILFFLVAMLLVPGLPAGEAVARIQAVSGLVEVLRGEDWYQVEAGDELEVQDQLRTDVDALVRVVFLDQDEARGAQATVVDLSGEAQIRIEEFLLAKGERPYRTGFLDLLRGALQALTKGWKNGSVFSVRAGTSVCGIRGSMANVAFDPTDESSTLTSLDGEVFEFEATDRLQAMERHRSAAQAFRARRRPSFVRKLDVGVRSFLARGKARRETRLGKELLSQARKALLDRQGPRNLKDNARWVKAFSRVRPTGRKPRKPTGKHLRDLRRKPQDAGSRFRQRLRERRERRHPGRPRGKNSSQPGRSLGGRQGQSGRLGGRLQGQSGRLGRQRQGQGQRQLGRLGRLGRKRQSQPGRSGRKRQSQPGRSERQLRGSRFQGHSGRSGTTSRGSSRKSDRKRSTPVRKPQLQRRESTQRRPAGGASHPPPNRPIHR